MAACVRTAMTLRRHAGVQEFICCNIPPGLEVLRKNIRGMADGKLPPIPGTIEHSGSNMILPGRVRAVAYCDDDFVQFRIQYSSFGNLCLVVVGRLEWQAFQLYGLCPVWHTLNYKSNQARRASAVPLKTYKSHVAALQRNPPALDFALHGLKRMGYAKGL